MRFKWKAKYLLFLSMAIVAITPIIFDFLILGGEKEDGLWWLRIHGFFALLGFIGCVILVVVSKWLGKYWLQRKKDYYD